jgi:RHS repeat-associated protein
MGNITSKSDVAAGATWTYHASKKHAVTQAGSTLFTYSYDNNGNAVTRNGYGITWNKYNYPTVINDNGESTALYYDANQERWKQVYTKGAATETTIYVGQLLEKVTAGADDYRYYISANGHTVAIMSRTSTGVNATRYMLRDYQGSVTKIADSSGGNVASESFTAYGARRNPATWSGSPTNGDQTTIASISRHGYTDHEALGSMGLNHMNGRVQDAITGRFLSPDPMGEVLCKTQSWNRYTYVNNNPLSRTDPTGFAGIYLFNTGDNFAEVVVSANRDHNAPDGSIGNAYGSLGGSRAGSSNRGGGGGGGGGGGSGSSDHLEEIVIHGTRPKNPSLPTPSLLPIANNMTAVSPPSLGGGGGDRSGGRTQQDKQTCINNCKKIGYAASTIAGNTATGLATGALQGNPGSILAYGAAGFAAGVAQVVSDPVSASTIVGGIAGAATRGGASITGALAGGLVGGLASGTGMGYSLNNTVSGFAGGMVSGFGTAGALTRNMLRGGLTGALAGFLGDAVNLAGQAITDRACDAICSE